jgi:hypothetical protein
MNFKLILNVAFHLKLENKTDRSAWGDLWMPCLCFGQFHGLNELLDGLLTERHMSVCIMR